MRYILAIIVCAISTAIEAQYGHKSYHDYWITDIPIWYNCGGFHALINYNFKGNATVNTNDEYGQKFKFKIANCRLVGYSYYNIKNSNGGRGEKHGVSAYYNAIASFSYEETSIKHHLRMYRGTGDWHDIYIAYENVGTDSLIKKCGYKDFCKKTGRLVQENGSTIKDTIPIVSPYYAWESTIKRLFYEVSPIHVKIYANYMNMDNSSLIIKFNKNGDVKHVYNSGTAYTFVNHKYDDNGNWTEVDVFDSNNSFIKKYRRTIEYD